MFRPVYWSAHIREPCFHLAPRPLLPQHDGTALIVAYDVERVLADIDANHGNCSVECLGHGVLLVFGAPCQLVVLAVPEHGPIPLSEVASSDEAALPSSASVYSIRSRCVIAVRCACLHQLDASFSP